MTTTPNQPDREREINLETVQIMASNLAAMVGLPLIAIVETKAGFAVHQHTVDSVAPQSIYPAKRDAASRILQLLGIGPVAPQTWPEEVIINSVQDEQS